MLERVKENRIRFGTARDLNSRDHSTNCAPISESPSNISTMMYRGSVGIILVESDVLFHFPLDGWSSLYLCSRKSVIKAK